MKIFIWLSASERIFLQYYEFIRNWIQFDQNKIKWMTLKNVLLVSGHQYKCRPFFVVVASKRHPNIHLSVYVWMNIRFITISFFFLLLFFEIFWCGFVLFKNKYILNESNTSHNPIDILYRMRILDCCQLFKTMKPNWLQGRWCAATFITIISLLSLFSRPYFVHISG